MTPDLTMTIKANTDLTVREYIEELTAEHDELTHYTGALVEVVEENRDYLIEIYNVPAMDGDYVSSTNGTRLLWMPQIGRAALNSYQAGDWAWTDADSPEDAIRRYHNDDIP